MTFAASLMRLVGFHPPARTSNPTRPESEPSAVPPDAAGPAGLPASTMTETVDESAPAPDLLELADPDAPGLADLRAAIELVSAGIASRVVLSRLRSWPGLLWQAHELARENDVVILPTTVHPDGRVDLEVSGSADTGG